MIKIKNRYTGDVIYTCDGDTLAGANFFGADLSGADLSGVNLSGADLSGTNLSRANLRGANLSYTDLSGANLFSANVPGADLSGANLSYTDLSYTDLSGANLRGANFTDALVLRHKVTKAPLQIFNLTWPILITERSMRIGCNTYTHDEWENFTGEELASRASGAFEFAEKWRTVLLYMCSEHAKA